MVEKSGRKRKRGSDSEVNCKDALGYASNDIVLIVLWILASMENPAYIPVAVNFMIFFFNDMYGFISWKRREAGAF